MRLWAVPIAVIGGCLVCEPDAPSSSPSPSPPPFDTSDLIDTGSPPMEKEEDLPPSATILGPDPAVVIRVPAIDPNPPFFAEITLEGIGDDPEDGALGGGDLIWTTDSDLQSPILGVGEQPLVRLMVEQCSTTVHTVTLTTTDSAGQTASDSVVLTVQHICPS